jgi:hypothetical protein
MTYGQVKTQVLRLLNQYSVAGEPLGSDYNNQADYIDRIPGLINDAMMEISTTVRKIEAEWVLDDPRAYTGDYTDLGDECSFAVPSDFFQLKSGDNLLLKDGRLLRHRLFLYPGSRTVVVPKRILAYQPRIFYYRYPDLLGENLEPATAAIENLVLCNTEDVHRAIPYYVAGMLALHDDPFLASSLMNAYEDKLAKMQPKIAAEVAPVQDAYAFTPCDYGG